MSHDISLQQSETKLAVKTSEAKRNKAKIGHRNRNRNQKANKMRHFFTSKRKSCTRYCRKLFYLIKICFLSLIFTIILLERYLFGFSFNIEEREISRDTLYPLSLATRLPGPAANRLGGTGGYRLFPPPPQPAAVIDLTGLIQLRGENKQWS